ncbi:unnamed protein product [Caenorhabditis sp. 36 PRJEB53466]|nr:unnamed protein product [Caenorhabditis sp. 36 PRJEB53466]
MSLIFRPRPFSLVGEMMRDMARMERQFVPFVDRIDNSAASEIVNNEEKFAVNLNVSQKLTIQGEQEEKTEHGFSKTSFSRVILLPEDVDVAAVASNLTPDGTLSIEAKKKEAIQGRAIPIQHAAVEHKPTE